jgi:uncharacterized phiE125 gp8 family phage protein
MAYRIITAATVEPVTLAEARLQCKLTDDDSTDEDALITAWITAAREQAEHYTGRALAVQTIEMALDCFPEYEDDVISLDMPPVTAITSVKYTDTAGVEQTISPSAYALSLYGDSRKLAPTYGNYWPSTRDIPDAARIRCVCGYASVPKAAKSAILLMVADRFENREGASDIPLAARCLLDTIKVYG